ncbi:hypothetical protein J8L98_04990 [Pseudoalteromonas sp. MMG013]|uniref:hypothetical protein n=1 Tax=Pseudoalteromonas sp. MMG013 TaxID=2822687 RepID=UPI001B387EC2|nr:hypothetical protein [Pseudoalteromonas sp. MMG013]MBQ4861053.1 hypothetical protein [Pseudoalteromonas sp. MMG013]
MTPYHLAVAMTGYQEGSKIPTDQTPRATRGNAARNSNDKAFNTWQSNLSKNISDSQ